MANVLNKDKQIAVIAALAEGNSIRSIERMTGIHRDTVMRLGVKIGQGCARLLDQKMRGLDCKRLELDEVWGYIGKKCAMSLQKTIRRLVMFGHSARLTPTQSLSRLITLPAIAASRTQLHSSLIWQNALTTVCRLVRML